MVAVPVHDGARIPIHETYNDFPATQADSVLNETMLLMK